MNTRSKQDTPAAYGGRCKIRNDIIFIVTLLLIVAFIGLYMLLFRSEGDMIKVTVEGKLYGEYSLSKDAVIEIRTGKDNENLNLLVIRDGKAYVETATCPDGICSAHRPVSRDGESIACLPHRVSITVYSRDDEADIVV